MVYNFGPFRYDADQRLLFRGPDRVPLVPKVAETLHVLIERHGEVVDKAELMKLIWPDAAVEEIGLARNVSLLRKALEDESTVDPIIETVPKRGYRFAAPVAPNTPVAPKPASRRGLIAIGVAAAIAALIYYQFYVPSRFLSSGGGASLAVIPFPCHCPGMDGEAFSEGLNEALVTKLTLLPAVHVLAPSTVRRHQRAGISTGLMGRLLGLDTLVEGSIQKLDLEIRTTVRLVDVHTGKVIWAGTFDQPASNSAAAQSVTARLAADAIGARLANSATR